MRIEIKDHVILIDDEDYDVISQYSWHLNHCSNTTYAFAHIDIFLHGKSSFDSYEFDGNAQQMDVLNRWKEYQYEVSKVVDKNMIIKWEELLHNTKGNNND